MSQILEALMIILFGISWPASIHKSFTSRSTKGKSLLFLCLIGIGYIAGISSKLISGQLTYVIFFYFLNLLMVGTDIILYFRNTRLEKAQTHR